MNARQDLLKEKIQSFPAEPGVYLMKDDKQRIIYVGKAKNLRSRTRQYFTDRDTRYQIRFLMDRVRDIDFLQTNTEREALLLENSLIKKHKPRYNLFLKDDKTYLGLKLTIRDEYPRLFETRRIKKDGSLYYGPFISSEKMREVKEFIDRHFLLRTCGDHEFGGRTRPCLEYQIKRCSAPCVNYVSREQYAEQIRAVRYFLEGKSRDLQRLVRERMDKAALELNFEEAARWRDLLSHMDMLLEKQNVTQLSFDFMDILALRRFGEDKVGIAVLMVREAQLIDSRYFILSSLEEDDECLQNFMTQYYSEDAFIPREILVPITLGAQDTVEALLTERAKARVVIRLPQKGEKREMLELADQNLVSHFDRARRKESDRQAMLEALQEKLHLKRLPVRIECYDNSHISGKQAVGSLVCFEDGLPDKDAYRRFRIRDVRTPDDFAMMFEVLKRRFRHREGKWRLPDLIVIDGGRGQLGMALKALEELGLAGLDVIAIAKGKGEGARAKGLWEGKKEEEIYLPHRKNPVQLPRGAAELMLLQRLRDESHRFAITYHRNLRDKDLTRSWLDDVPGIGQKRKLALLSAFGSPQAVAEADLEALAAVPGMTREAAAELYGYRAKIQLTS